MRKDNRGIWIGRRGGIGTIVLGSGVRRRTASLVARVVGAGGRLI